MLLIVKATEQIDTFSNKVSTQFDKQKWRSLRIILQFALDEPVITNWKVQSLAQHLLDNPSFGIHVFYFVVWPSISNSSMKSASIHILLFCYGDYEMVQGNTN